MSTGVSIDICILQFEDNENVNRKIKLDDVNFDTEDISNC